MVKDKTKIFSQVDSGRSFNRAMVPDFYDQRELDIEWSEGNQWLGYENTDHPKATFNYEKRFLDLFVAMLCSAKTGVSIKPFNMSATPEIQAYTRIAKKALQGYNALADSEWEDLKREAVRKAGQQGEVYIHYLFDPEMKTALGEVGEIEREIVTNNNVIFGNPNNNVISIKTQPYIIITGRDFVKNLKEEAKANNQDPSKIKPDDEDSSDKRDTYEESSAVGYEMATYAIKYRYDKKEKTIMVSKATETGDIFEEIDTKYTRYPVNNMIWDSISNNYHGHSLVFGLHHTQNFVNKSFALLMYHTTTVAYGNPVINGDYIKNYTGKLGKALVVKGLPPSMSLNQVYSNTQPSQLSGAIVECIDKAIYYMKEVSGITDVLLGNVDPENKGAIIVTTKNAQAAQENQRASIRTMTRNDRLILLDMMIAKYGKREIIVEEDSGMNVVNFDFSLLKDVPLNVTVEIGDASFFSEVGQTQTLDNLFNAGIIDAINYLKRTPADIPEKEELISELESRLMPENISVEDMKAKFAGLSDEQKAEISAAPPEKQAALIRQYMSV